MESMHGLSLKKGDLHVTGEIHRNNNSCFA